MIYHNLFILTAFYNSKPHQQFFNLHIISKHSLQAAHVNPKDINSHITTSTSFDSNLKRHIPAIIQKKSISLISPCYYWLIF